MSALAQALMNAQQIQGQQGGAAMPDFFLQGNNAQGQQQPDQNGQPIPQANGGNNALDTAFQAFIQKQHQQMQGGQSNSYLNLLPWFQGGGEQNQQSAFNPPAQSQGAAPAVGSGGALGLQSLQDQVNRGGDMSSMFPTGKTS